MGGSRSTGTNSPNDSTCSGLSAVKFRSETSCCDSSLRPRMKSNSLRRIKESFRLMLVVLRRCGKEVLEFLLVEALVVGLIGCNPLHSQMLHYRVVQRLVSQLFADLNHAGDLMGLAFANEIGDGRGKHQNLHRRHAPLLVNTPEKALGHNAFERFGKGCTDFVLLLRGKDVNHTVDGFGGALGVKRSKNQVAGAGRGQG